MTEKPAHDASASSNQGMVNTLQILVACMVPFFGIINTLQSQYLQTQLQQVKQEAERKQQFAGSIQSQLNNLTGNDPTRAKVALASLYTLAREEGDKAILFTIAIVSQNEELKQTVASLVADDSSLSQAFKTKVSSKLGRIFDANKIDNGVPRPKGQPDLSTEKRLLERLTQDIKNLEGWIYLGKTVGQQSQLGQDKTISSTTVPAKGQQVTLTTSVNLRDSAPKNRTLGNTKGIVGKGVQALVQDIKRKPIAGTNDDAVWAQVSISE